ncbi:MAG: sulfotransferase, partial [Terriglobia bacterium]
MQIVILGMHRSGTSPLTRIINLMGAYVGMEGTLMEPYPGNPKGFWERTDVLALHQEVLKTLDADWYRVANFDLDKLTENHRATFERKAREIIRKLDAHRPWVMKDPRMCLLLPLWQPLLEAPICVHIYRSPLEVAQSLRTRNGFSIHFGAALWEKHNLAALTNSRKLPRLFVSHQRLLGEPIETVRVLYEQLLTLGVHGLRLPSEWEILAFLDPALYRERGDASLRKEFVSFPQEELFQAFEEGTASDFDEVRSLSAGAQEALEHAEIEEERERQRRLTDDAVQAKEAELTTLHQKVMALEQQCTEAEQKRMVLAQSKAAEVKAWQQQCTEAEQKRMVLAQSKAAEVKAWQQRLAEAEQQRTADVQTLQQ